ncbi:MAG: hypothetical protein H6668_17660 [Ardenticatenaceae bacterium]|nr:hypothetical protein [Ardenticatenaceae bacterium]
MSHPSIHHDPLVDHLTQQLWQNVMAVAQTAGLDTSKFTAIHRAVVADVAAYLATAAPMPQPADPSPPSRLSQWVSRVAGRSNGHLPPTPTPPIILCGEPGTGKTTFLYVLDMALRQKHGLPDNIRPKMVKQGQFVYTVEKRPFCGTPLSLLSVKKWARLLHFYAWDTTSHRLRQTDQDAFIQNTLLPMRVIFADEVEMVGYSPTIPDLVAQGLLLVGSSNQYEFAQLVRESVPPKIYTVTGDDMRLGNPDDAAVLPGSELWRLFELGGETAVYETLPYKIIQQPSGLYLHFNFDEAIRAPLLEPEWVQFLRRVYTQITYVPLQPEAHYTLLLDHFSLETLQTNYNGILRLVALFDAIEQLGMGAVIRHPTQPPDLSRTAFARLKTTIQNQRGVDIDIKQRALVGVGRCISRLGQAAHRAQR